MIPAFYAAVIAAVLVPEAAYAQNVADGDTLRLDGKTYRLWGIDAPETKQDCPDGWPAGRLATTQLQTLIKGRQIVCEAKDTDRYGRTVAICRAGGEDLGALMVRSGMAWAFVRYSSDYVDQEAQAKEAAIGSDHRRGGLIVITAGRSVAHGSVDCGNQLLRRQMLEL